MNDKSELDDRAAEAAEVDESPVADNKVTDEVSVDGPGRCAR